MDEDAFTFINIEYTKKRARGMSNPLSDAFKFCNNTRHYWSLSFLYLFFISLPVFNAHLSQMDTLLYNSFYLSIVGFILYAIGLIGAWKWRKWGILLMVATSDLLDLIQILGR